MRTVYFVSNVFPEAIETQVGGFLLDRALQFQSVPPLQPAYNMGGANHLSEVKTIHMVLIENLNDTGYSIMWGGSKCSYNC